MENFGEGGYVAWIEKPNSFKMVVQADSPENAAKELLISLKVTLSHTLGINIEDIDHKEFASEEELQKSLTEALKETGTKELKFAFC